MKTWKKILLTGGLVIGLTGCSKFFNDYNTNNWDWKWTTTEYNEMTAMNVAIMSDWVTNASQSRNVSCHQINPIMGPHPSQSTYTLYYIGLAGVSNGMAYLLPQQVRDGWLLSVTGVETYMITSVNTVSANCR
jgi:hypothetical protein